MKKEYFKPAVKSVRIQHAYAILAESSVGKFDTDGEETAGDGGASKEDIGW